MADHPFPPDDERQEPKEPTDITLDTSDDGPAGQPPAPLSADARQLLVRVLRVAYPHPSFPDGPYERTAAAIEAGADTEAAAVLADGLKALSDSGFASLNDDAARTHLETIATEAFFRQVHAVTVVTLYDDPEVWKLLGYEGESFDKGGYLHRGFDDLDWLPDPRIEEFDGEPRVELVPADSKEK